MKFCGMAMFVVMWVVGCAIASFFPKDLDVAWMMLWGYVIGMIGNLISESM